MGAGRTEVCDSRGTAAIGRDARLELWFEKRRGRTILARSYAEPPFRVGRALELGDAAYVIVVCAAPGVFPGDALCQSVHVGAGARVVLTSQAALQAHPGSAPTAAAIDHCFSLETGAELHCRWDPIIPFAGARVGQRFHVRMPSSARLFWSDGVIAGRVARGERWRFTDLAHELRVEIDGVVRYLERYRLASGDAGLERAVTRPWIAGDAHYAGTALLRHPRATAEVAEAIYRELGRFQDVRAAADLVEPSLVASRLMAARGASFADARAALGRFVLEHVFESSQLAGRKSPIEPSR